MDQEHPREYIYALKELSNAEYPVFYVGRTSDMTRRLKEHQYASKTGTEAKYQYIRQLEAAGIKWEMVLLEEVGEDTEHYEDYFVYLLSFDGHELCNMKMGDAKQQAEQDAIMNMRATGQFFSNAKDFLSARERAIKEEEARIKAAKLNAKIRSDETSKSSSKFVNDGTHGESIMVGEDPNKKFMSEGTRKLLEKFKMEKK